MSKFFAYARTRNILVAGLLGVSGLAARGQTFQFVDVSANSGIDFPLSFPRPCAAVADIDGDGKLDLFMCGGTGTLPRCYHNNGNATFTDVTETTMPEGIADLSYATFADIDNDSDPDLIGALRYDGYLDVGFGYYINDHGVLRPGYVTPDLARHNTAMGGMTVADFDKDGDLDVVFMHNNGFGGLAGGPGFYLRNDNGTFVDATAAVGGGIGISTRHWAVVAADFNNDGWADVHSAVDFYKDFQCRNNGNGTMRDVSISCGVTNTGSDMGLAVGDFDNDGDLDIYSTNISEGVLYVNNGTGTFTNEASVRGPRTFPGVGWGTAFVDLDLDGDLDLPFVSNNQPGYIWENLGDGTFKNSTAGSGTELLGHGLLPFDFDGDGDVDLLVWSADEYPLPRLYENRTPRNGRHWLTVRAIGTISNRDSIGARVVVSAGGKQQMREILGNYSFFSGPPKEAHFGLNQSAIVSVTVTWPSGQTATRLTRADRVITLTEPLDDANGKLEQP